MLKVERERERENGYYDRERENEYYDREREKHKGQFFFGFEIASLTTSNALSKSQKLYHKANVNCAV